MRVRPWGEDCDGSDDEPPDDHRLLFRAAFYHLTAMSFAISSPGTCCSPCPDPVTTTIPGPQGPEGPAGADGTDGVDAYTALTAQFTMPAEGDTIVAEVGNSEWMVPGQIVFLGAEGSAASGYFQVESKADATHVTLLNLEDTAAGEYVDNAVPGTIFPIGISVGPAGLQGPRGADGTSGAPDDATYITQTPSAGLSAEQALSVLATGLMRSTTGTGVVDIVALTTASGAVAPNDGLLTAGNAVFGTASGIETKTAAAARNALELAKGTADTNTPQVDDASGLTAGEILRSTASGIESVDDATIKAQLGITGGVGAVAVFQNQQLTSINGGGLTQGSWVTSPFNTEVSDAGNIASVAANEFTLVAGTYRVRWSVPCYGVESFQTRLVQDATAYPGSNAEASAALEASSVSEGFARITVPSGGVYTCHIEAQCEFTNASSAYGVANNFGGTEVYGTIEFEKEN